MSGTTDKPVATSGWVPAILRLARIVSATIAVGCIIVFVIGLCIVLYFEADILSGAPQMAVPSPYVASAPVIDLQNVAARIEPPSHVRVVVSDQVIDSSVESTDVLGSLAADTANGLATYPNDIDIVGGPDTDLFDRAASSDGQHAVLVATPALTQQIDALLPTLKARVTRTYHLELVARDRFGLYSVPTDAAFTLVFAPPTPPPSQPAAVPAASVIELRRLAHEIGLVIDKEGTPAYQAAYATALDEPDHCGAADTDSAFVASYRRAFDYTRAKLSPANLKPFLDGVCDAWRGAIDAQAQAATAAAAARGEAIARNQAARFRQEIEAAAARIERNLSLGVVGSTIGAFLLVSLILGFLAIESHSRATREAISRLTMMRTAPDGGPPERSASNPIE